MRITSQNYTSSKGSSEADVNLDYGELSVIALNGLDLDFATAYAARADDIPFSAFQGLLQAHEARSSRPAVTQQFTMANMVKGNHEVITCQICSKRSHSAISFYN